jgi:hypothetical protein
MSIFYCLYFWALSTWKARFLYLFPPRTGQPSYTPGQSVSLTNLHIWKYIYSLYMYNTYIMPLLVQAPFLFSAYTFGADRTKNTASSICFMIVFVRSHNSVTVERRLESHCLATGAFSD